MHNKAIIHIMTKSRMKSEMFASDLDAMEEVSEKYGIKNVIFYKGEEIEYADLINKLEKFGIYVHNYSNKEDLKEQVAGISEDYEVVCVNTMMELLVNVVNEVKEALGMPMSDNSEIFRNKFLQRELIQSHNPDLGIKFIKGEPENLDINEIEEKIGYPFIVKPVDGVQSSGVEKICNKKEFQKYIERYAEFHDRLKARGVDNKELIIEEFIDGKLYSVDYFVDGEGNVTTSKPVKVKLGIDVKVEDYCNIARISTEKTEEDFKGKRVKTFINSTVKACGIRNTFVHHEFKINSKGELKTIELNGRIGGGRLEIIKRAYDLNMYEMICNPDIKPGKVKENNIVVNIYATKRGMLRSFNNSLLAKFKRRESVFGIMLEETKLGKEVGLTKDGFVKVGAIRLAHKDYSILRKDFLYIKSKYDEILNIDEFDENRNIKKKGLFKRFREYINQ